MFHNLTDIQSLFNIEMNENPVLNLTESKYDFPDKEIGIRFPLSITSSINSSLSCKKIIILAPNVDISGIKLNGSIIIDSCDNITIHNCTFDGADSDSGGAIVVNHANEINLTNLYISGISVSGIFAPSSSKINIKFCHIFNITDSLIYISNSSHVLVDQCELYQSTTNGITVTSNSILEVKNTEIHHTRNPAIQAIQSTLFCSNSNFHDVEQNGININHCNETRFINNKFKNIKSSSISVSFRSQGFISENIFEDISGNSIFVSEESKATILKNTVIRTFYPAFAVLQRCSVQISYNNITSASKSGICVRGASRAVLDANEIEDVADCGISISDSNNCVLMHNKIKKCKVAGFEAYNQAKVTIHDNQIIDCGKFGIMVYTWGHVTASRNKFMNISEAFVHLSTYGEGSFTSNDISKCPKLLDGNSMGTFLFQDNFPFESITNDENNQDSEITKIPKYVDPCLGKCLKCREAPRECFLVPCGHKIVCNNCGEKAVEANELCPLCRFKIVGFTEGFSNSDDSLCSICLEKAADSIVLPCGHTGFCVDCLNEWFNENVSCPVCRTDPAVFRKILPDF